MKLDILTSTALGLYFSTAVAGTHLQDGVAGQSSGPVKEIPAIGLGTWLSDKEKVADAVEYALTNGYNHIDAALIYGNEKQVGKGIASSKVARHDIWITSKLWNEHHRPYKVHEAIRATLSDLGVDYLDLYLMHWPVAFVPDDSSSSGGTEKIDKHTSILQTWRAMEELVRLGLTRHIGISNFARADVERLLRDAEIRPYAHEFETHPYLQQQDFVDWHEDIGVKVIAYSPLANTNPTYDGHKPVAPILDDLFWVKIADEKDCSVAQAVLGWGLERGTVVIPKSVHKDYIKQNLGALEVEFGKKEMKKIAMADKKTRFNDPGKGWGIKLFRDLDDPTELDDDDDLSEL